MQVIGIFALVASLLFVGYQVKQTRDIAISQAFQARAESSAAAYFEMAANDALVAGFLKDSQERAGDITPEELMAMNLTLSGGIYLWENSFYQSRLGYVGQDHWIRTRAQMKNTMSQGSTTLPFARSLAPFMRPEFRDELETIFAEVENERGAQ